MIYTVSTNVLDTVSTNVIDTVSTNVIDTVSTNVLDTVSTNASVSTNVMVARARVRAMLPVQVYCNSDAGHLDLLR